MVRLHGDEWGFPQLDILNGATRIREFSLYSDDTKIWKKVEKCGNQQRGSLAQPHWAC